MPITKAAKKALRQSKKRQQCNIRIKNRIKTITRQVNDLIKAGKKVEAEKALQKAYSALDKATKKKKIKKNTAARRKSRLASAVNKAGGKKKQTKTTTPKTKK
ncbi:30S ribosomal protein S20 [Patescibacteria group bacterium]|nr:30S ribosomal protein S20 [Patescibacteria group bacterium]